jgi:hypothetical protein
MGLVIGIRDPEKTYLGSRIQSHRIPDPGSVSATLKKRVNKILVKILFCIECFFFLTEKSLFP